MAGVLCGPLFSIFLIHISFAAQFYSSCIKGSGLEGGVLARTWLCAGGECECGTALNKIM